MSDKNYLNLIDFGSSKIRFSVYDTHSDEIYVDSKSILYQEDHKNHFNFIVDTVKKAEKKYSANFSDLKDFLQKNRWTVTWHFIAFSLLGIAFLGSWC